MLLLPAVLLLQFYAAIEALQRLQKEVAATCQSSYCVEAHVQCGIIGWDLAEGAV